MQRQFASKSQQVYLLPGHSIEPLITKMPEPVQWVTEYEELGEEDVVNIALFGITQRQFEQQYPRAAGTVHNNSSISHIITHASLRSKNAELISAGAGKHDRLMILNEIAIEQTTSLDENNRKRIATTALEQTVVSESVGG